MAQARKRDRPAMVLTTWGLSGFKSHFEYSALDFSPLTILCGANSSGKSSFMQPLLLLKQTLDALPLDAGALKLDGPNISFSDPHQFSARRQRIDKVPPTLVVSLGFSPADAPKDTYKILLGFQVTRRRGHRSAELELETSLYQHGAEAATRIKRGTSAERLGSFLIPVRRQRTHEALPFGLAEVIRFFERLIHLSGHRGNPERQYARVVVSEGRQPGLFHTRAASTLAAWQDSRSGKLKRLSHWLKALGLSWKAEAIARDATSFEILVGRTTERAGNRNSDLVSVADVGFGVSQSLPVLIGLIEAEPGQLVYVEQPEIHLHPRAQKGMADLIASRVSDGVRVVVETHSEILLTRLQHAVAVGTLRPDQVIAHWFQRDPRTGQSTISSQTPDAAGALGEWPVDFADIASEVDLEYAEAAYERLAVEDDE